MNKRDFVAYLKFGRRGLRANSPPPIPESLERGPLSAYKVFDKFDTHGKLLKQCKHPRVFRAVMYGKLSLNFHITDIWGYSLALTAKECGAWLAIIELRELHQDLPYLPAWVWRSLAQKIRKVCPYWIGILAIEE